MTEYKVISEIEYKILQKDEPTIGLCMIVKNEHLRLNYTLESVKDVVSALIMFDTGSTDDTLDIIKNFAEKYKINLYLIQGTFVDFSVSRNVSLEYADKFNVEYLLLLDCNDELQGGNTLLKIAKNIHRSDFDGVLMRQVWNTGFSFDKYFNIRFVRNHKGWRYKGSVHEYIVETSLPQGVEPKIFKIDEIEVNLFQDRTKDDDKTSKRFVRDYDFLVKDYKSDPTNTRTLMYLAQTCSCLMKHDEAIFYSKERLKYEGFVEERYHSYMRCGDSYFLKKYDWTDVVNWFIACFTEFDRAEPLVKIAEYYHQKVSYYTDRKISPKNLWRIAYLFIDMACKTKYPEQALLFVDSQAYDYKRWHLLGIIGFYANEIEKGRDASLKAYKAKNHDVDKNNYSHYLKQKIVKPIKRESSNIVNYSYFGAEESEYNELLRNLNVTNIQRFVFLCDKLDKSEELLFYAKLGIKILNDTEKRYYMFMMQAKALKKLKYDWDIILPKYLNAFEESNRVEPLFYIAEHYYIQASELLDSKKPCLNYWRCAFMFINEACEIEYPEYLFETDKDIYDYKRWHLLGIIGFYANEHEIGKMGAQKAYSVKGLHIDKANIDVYNKKPISQPIQLPEDIPYKQYIEAECFRMLNNNKNMTRKQAEKIAQLSWKAKKDLKKNKK